VFFSATALVSDNKDFQVYVKNKYGDNGLQTLSFINNAGKYFAGAYMGRGAVNYISSSLEKKAIQETLKRSGFPKLRPVKIGVASGKVKTEYLPVIEVLT
jgi:hypothetical protein